MLSSIMSTYVGEASDVPCGRTPARHYYAAWQEDIHAEVVRRDVISKPSEQDEVRSGSNAASRQERQLTMVFREPSTDGQSNGQSTLRNRDKSRNLSMRFQSLSQKFIPFLALALLAVTAATAQQPLNTLLVDVDHRPAVSLDGPWHYLVDMTGANLYTA